MIFYHEIASNNKSIEQLQHESGCCNNNANSVCQENITFVDAVWRMQFLFSFRNFIVLNILHAIWKEFNLKDNIAYKVINLLAIYLNYEHWTWTYCLIRLVNGISAFYFHRNWRCFSCFFNLMLHCQVEMSINWRSAWTWN